MLEILIKNYIYFKNVWILKFYNQNMIGVKNLKIVDYFDL